MATNTVTLAHLMTIREAINAAISNVTRYQGYNDDMTSAAKAALLATVTTVPSALQHASNCSTCNGWDGSA
tara:strand:- start:8 stop:220 length:213 start_codon:yes stop_codon:yes gene_type:complete